MKTKSLFMAVAVLTIAGCSQNEVMEMNPDTHRAIGLDVYTGVHTKGAETTTSTIKNTDAGFGIFAYKTTKDGWDSEKASTKPEFMYNEHATWVTDSWSYTTSPRFWPLNDDKITFFAYAPYDADGTGKGITLSAQTENGAPKITFEVKTSNDWKDMVDLVVDKRDDIKNQTSESNESNAGTVSFKFSHVLTKIANVKVKPSIGLGENTKIFVRELKLLPGSGILYMKGVYSFDDDTWGETSPAATYCSKDQDLSKFLNTKGAENAWGYTETSIEIQNQTDNATALFPENQYLYFIPVNNGSGTSKEGDLNLKITYDIVTKVDNDNHLVSTVTDRVVKLPQGTFKKGTAHTYVLTIKMNTIKIAVEDNMTSWTANKDEEIEVKKDTGSEPAN